MTSESVAQRLHAAASADAALASDLRAAYRGRHDVLDALWWRAYPLTATPGGRPDPAAELPRLQAAVYARPGPDGSLVESERRLGDLTARLRQDDADLDAVLLLFPDGTLPASSPGAPHSAGSPRAPGGHGGSSAPGAPNAPDGHGSSGAPSTPGAPGTPGGPGTPGAPGAHGGPGGPCVSGAPVGTSDADGSAQPARALRGPTRRRGVLLVAAGVLVGGIAVAAVSTLLPHGGGAGGPGAEAAVSASPGLLALYDQPQIPDQTTIDLGPEFRRDSIHAMFVERETSSVVYVARRGEDLYCVILRAQGQQGASVCVGLAELARRGLNLTATVPVNPFTLGKDSLEPAGALADVTIRVSTDGVVSSDTAPHPTN